MSRELLVVLVERFLSHFAIGRNQKLRKRAVAEFNFLAVFVFDRSEFQIRVVELPEDSTRRTSHLALHRQQLFFFFAKGVLFVTSQSLQAQLVQRQAILLKK